MNDGKHLPKYPGYTKLMVKPTLDGSEAAAGWVVLDLVGLGSNSSQAFFVIGMDADSVMATRNAEIDQLKKELAAAKFDTKAVLVNLETATRDNAKLQEKAKSAIAELNKLGEQLASKFKMEVDFGKLRDALGQREVNKILGPKDKT